MLRKAAPLKVDAKGLEWTPAEKREEFLREFDRRTMAVEKWVDSATRGETVTAGYIACHTVPRRENGRWSVDPSPPAQGLDSAKNPGTIVEYQPLTATRCPLPAR